MSQRRENIKTAAVEATEKEAEEIEVGEESTITKTIKTPTIDKITDPCLEICHRKQPTTSV